MQVYLILDEFICGGEIQETAKKVCRCEIPEMAGHSCSSVVRLPLLPPGDSGTPCRAGQDRHLITLGSAEPCFIL